MEEFEEKIKKALDQQLFNQLNLSDTEVTQFTDIIIQKSRKSKSKKIIKTIAPAIATLLLLVISSLLLRNIIIDSNGVAASIEEAAVAEFGKPVVIPALEEFPIIFSAITKPAFLDNPSDLTISYSTSQGELDPSFQSNDQRKLWEKNQQSILLYGPYLSKEVFNIQYRPGRMEFGNSDGQERVINGMTVEYDHFKRDAGEFVLVIINTAVGNYTVQMNITEEFTLLDSEKVIEEITRQLKG
jgi:hypothetical protein